MLSEVSQMKKDNYSMISLICRILKSQNYRNGEQNGACPGLGGGGDGKMLVNRYKLPFIR